MRAVLDRPSPDRAETGSLFRSGDLEVDIDRHRVMRGGEPLELTPTEFCILVTLIREPRKVLSARSIVVAAGVRSADDTGYIRRYVRHRRRKLERDPHHSRYVVNGREIGYRYAGAVE